MSLIENTCFTPYNSPRNIELVCPEAPRKKSKLDNIYDIVTYLVNKTNFIVDIDLIIKDLELIINLFTLQ